MLRDWLPELWSMVVSGNLGGLPGTVALSPLRWLCLQIKMQEEDGGKEKVTIALA